MSKPLHLVSGLLAPACVATFIVSTVLAEWLGSPQEVATVKALVVTPGLWILIPAMAVAGASGMRLARSPGGAGALAKRNRMRLIAANGLLVLLPCALVLARWAAASSFDAAFYALQTVELLAGVTNLALMLLNVRDGLRTSRRTQPSAKRAPSA